MDLQLTDKLALVTGSTGGIGFAIAQTLVAEGASVIVNGRSQSSVDDAVAKMRSTATGEVMGLAADLSSTEGVDLATEKYPQIDILVNNLGIYEAKPFLEITDEDWQKIFTVNVMSGVRLSRTYLPKMLAKNWGRIIFISSESGVQIPTEMIHYGMTKSAQIAVSRGLAELTTNTEVTVNSILPGPTKSKGVKDFIEKMAKQKNTTVEEVEKEFFAQNRPTSILQRFAETTEVANLVAYVASPLASATNGAALRVEGGILKSAF
ncbi:SDR family NAD(P)-dependent oxidoreductase [Oscillatoriales cyanobacterium LEGE 11467]|uniref:SDR family NAD(P)-dependent oxidoreductase n=1 Tax=Zarconia navalis LEGE 11467 TaxID=1828826 RepID=A0A928W197_9CYAN|nr:SDR family NAD(P)-dependent oxidoreductase [Zarconia navalis]MBE9042043.1 SDR family NAD(P)-dependent oxidoreductase [Zarconia navalis LEGE 11467]